MSTSNNSLNFQAGIVSVLGMIVLLTAMAAYAVQVPDTGQNTFPEPGHQVIPEAVPSTPHYTTKEQASAHSRNTGQLQAPALTAGAERRRVTAQAQPEPDPDEDPDPVMHQPPPSPDPPGDQPTIVVDELTHDFGEIWSGDHTDHTFIVKNEGQAPLKLLRVKTSCGCTVSRDYDKEIAPGQTGKIPVTFKSKNQKGKFSKTITVTSNDPSQQKLTLKITGVVKRYVEVKPSSHLQFGSIQTHEEKAVTVKLINNSDQPMEITLDKSDFGNVFTAELKEEVPGQEYKLTVTAKPPFQEGRNRATIPLKTSLQREPLVRVYATVNVQPRIEVVPRQLRIYQSSSSETRKDIRMLIRGNAPVQLIEATTNEEKLTLTTSEIKPGKEFKISVTVPPGFMPQRTGTNITLKTDDTEKPVINIPILGRSSPRHPALHLVGKPAPQVQFTTNNAVSVNTAEIDDRALVLVVYASWCRYCKATLPELEKIHQAYKDRGVTFVGLCQDNPNDRISVRRATPEQSISKLQELGITFDMAFDADKKIGNQFKAKTIPTTYVIDKSGKIVNVHSGAIRGRKIANLIGDLDKALQNPPPEEESKTVPPLGSQTK